VLIPLLIICVNTFLLTHRKTTFLLQVIMECELFNFTIEDTDFIKIRYKDLTMLFLFDFEIADYVFKTKEFLEDVKDELPEIFLEYQHDKHLVG
jgi:hypothetical protein